MEQLEVWVNKLPKSCRSCPFRCYGECLCGEDILSCDYSTMKCHLKKQKPKECPLKLITDYKPQKEKTKCKNGK